MVFLDDGIPIDEDMNPEYYEDRNLVVGDEVWVTPRPHIDFIRMKGVVTDTSKFEGMFVRVKTDDSERFYHIAKVQRIV